MVTMLSERAPKTLTAYMWQLSAKGAITPANATYINWMPEPQRLAAGGNPIKSNGRLPAPAVNHDCLHIIAHAMIACK